MPSHLKIWIDRFTGRDSALPSLDVLAASASATDSLESRLNWLVDVVQWIRRPGHETETNGAPDCQVQAGRLRRFLDVLERNPEWRRSVARTLRSIIKETCALELFSETGLPRQFGLISEVGERLGRKFLPSPPGSAELGVVFDRLFPHRRDRLWIESLDEATLQRLGALLQFEAGADEKGWNTLAGDLEDALIHLAAHLRVAGCSALLRSRIKHERIRELPFFKLSSALQAALTAREEGEGDAVLAELNYLHQLVEGCHRAVEEVLGHLEKRGVSTNVVYQLAFIEAALDRFASLLDMTFNPELPWTRISAFLARLVRENQARESVTDLFRQNFQLLTRKIVERNGEMGEHYIARTVREYGEMLRRAAGGGVIMAFTTWIKTIILGWHWPGLPQGLAASANYATGFVAIQLSGSTLATKQPATTAAALAARMHRVREPHTLEALVDEIVCLIRSQFAAVVGNLALVVPTVLLLNWLILKVSGAPMLTPEKAVKTLHSLSVFGPSLLYAAFTGVLLWASSLVAAWADNWFVCHRIGESLTADRRLIRTLGTSRTARFARFLQKNIGGFGGNISFGFMLGLIPEAAAFAGLPLDIRHVTLSSSLAAASVATLGTGVMATAPFWLAVLGVVGIGALNLAVSFSLALLVAIRARGIQSPERQAIYTSLLRRLRQQPLSFIFPVAFNGPAAAAEPRTGERSTSPVAAPVK